jgi:drug/metabolite transporter (DMT)-like permease
LLLLALISHAAGQSLIIWALAHLSASFSSLTLLIQPVVAAILAWVLFAESLTVTQIAGAVLVLAAIPLASRSSRRVTNAS